MAALVVVAKSLWLSGCFLVLLVITGELDALSRRLFDDDDSVRSINSFTLKLPICCFVSFFDVMSREFNKKGGNFWGCDFGINL